MKKARIKKIPKFISPSGAAILLLAVGLALIGVAFIFQDDIRTILVGIGVALVSSAMVNWVWSNVTQEKIREINDKIKMVNDITLEVLGVQSNVRRGQSIDIDFKREDDSIIATITHIFHYQEDGKSGQSFTMQIFSDFRGKVPSINKVFTFDTKPDFYFQYIRIDGAKVCQWDIPDHRKDLCNVKWGKLFFSREITLPSKGTVLPFEFKIENKYGVYDRLVWTFQEFSDCPVMININIDPLCKRCDELSTSQGNGFYFRIDHPLVKEIVEEYNKTHPDEIDEATGEIKVNTLSFPINKNVLPYQGFEISWDLSKKSTEVEPSLYDFDDAEVSES